MKKGIISLFCLCIAFVGMTQKIKIKEGIATVDGVAYIKFDRVDAMASSAAGLNADREEIFVQWLNYKDPNQVQPSNPQGNVSWVELNFIDFDLKCEIANQIPRNVVKVMYENKLYVDGVLNRENVERFVKKYGTRYSSNRPGGNINIIINK